MRSGSSANAAAICFLRPDKLIDHAYIGSFSGALRDECVVEQSE